ncbi:MAG: response regulator transcription factor [Chitinophagaceae bacterium]|nr:response regulator transcription factor [Chitinophagaceae bacterium]
MQKYKCIIVEDEPLATNVLKSFIQRIPYLELKGEFREAISASQALQQNETDIMFLDIHLPEIKGLDFLRTLTNSPVVILTTAYHQYAIDGFELSVTDYLLKPFSFDRFLLSVNKAVKQINASEALAKRTVPADDSLFLTIDRRKVKILLDEILYVESSREYVKIFTSKTSYISRIGTSELEKILPPQRFRRVQRSFIVAIDKIDSYSKEYVEINGKRISIGAAFKKEMDYFKNE